MGIEVNPLENETNQILEESINSFYEDQSDQKEETDEEVKEEVVKEEVTENIEEESQEEETTEESSEEEATDEVEDGKEIDEEEPNLTSDLRGVFSKDHISLLESIKDQDLRGKLIQEGKKSRSDLDRKRLELGETKKLVETLDEAVRTHNLNYNRQQYGDLVKNFMGFDALFARDPKQAIENLAKTAKIDLNTLGNKTVPGDVSEDDYRTPEEVKRDQDIQVLREELNLIKNQKQQQEQVSVQQELNDFANTKDSDGELKFPHFEKVRKDMGLFFNDSNPEMTMEKAYKKAILLDDELVHKRDENILKKAELKRKTDIEKAKKLKRQSVRSSKVSSTISNPAKKLESIVNDFYA